MPAAHGAEVRIGGGGRGYLAASVHVEQAHAAGQLLGVLDAVPQDAGGEIQGALVRLKRKRRRKDTLIFLQGVRDTDANHRLVYESMGTLFFNPKIMLRVQYDQYFC